MRDCPHIPELKYSEFSRRLRGGASADERLPISGGVELTARCNLRCAHCYVNEPLSARGDLEAEVSERILSEIADAGCLWLLLTGGEPLVREDFPRLYRFAKNKGFLITLFTNATLVTPEHAALLKDLKPFRVEVTVYGATEQTYERVTRVRGSFRQCLKGISRLAAALQPDPPTGPSSGPGTAPNGSRLCLKTMALSLNAHELKGIERLAQEHGAIFRYDPLVMGRIDGKEGPRRVRMSPADVLAVDMADPRRVREWVKAREQFRGPLRESDRVFQCGGGVNTFFVEAKGRLVMCPVARSWGYDLTRGTFQEGWAQARRARRGMMRTRPSPCATCHLAGLCGQCPGWGETEHGDPEARVEYLCRIAHLRADYLERLSPIRKGGRTS